jgi:hypothetical protein
MEPKVGVGVLDMLVDNAHITIFWIVLLGPHDKRSTGASLCFLQGTVNSHHCIEWKE